MLLKNMQEEVNDMERKLPKNIRQIGNVSDNPKVYIEDYVDTFINQMCEKATEGAVGAFLIGESFRKDDNDYIFIHGAVQMQDIEMRGNEIVIGDKTWKKACEEGKRHFAGNTILGWFMTAPGLQVKLNNNLLKLHERLFMKKSRMLILKDSIEKEEAVFVYKYNDLMHIGGHYIYYEKNPGMQDYMIAKRKQNCVTPSEAVEDRATKDFRSIIKSKEEQQRVQSKTRYSHMASTFLILLLVIMGVASMNNYEKLQDIESVATNAITSLWSSKDTQVETVFVTGTESDIVEAVNGEETSTEVVNGEETSTEVVNGEETSTETANTEEASTATANIEETSVEVANTEVVDEEDTNTEIENEDVATQEVETESVTQASDDTVETQEGQGDELSSVPDTEVTTKIYTVQAGDGLAQICQDMYGTIYKVDEVCILNGLENSDYIYEGQELVMP